jgi:elongation factor 1-gamma
VKQAESVLAVQSAKKPSQPKEPAKPKVKDEPKKEAKKEVKKEPAESAEEEEAPKPKAKNPLDLLPNSKMILDDWKRLYSNTKTNFREVAVKGDSLLMLFTHASKHILFLIYHNPYGMHVVLHFQSTYI